MSATSRQMPYLRVRIFSFAVYDEMGKDSPTETLGYHMITWQNFMVTKHFNVHSCSTCIGITL